MFKKAVFVSLVAIGVAIAALAMLKSAVPIGLVVLALGFVPLAGLMLAKRTLTGALADMIFGAVGKMSGCLLGAGLVLTLALAAGIRPEFP